MAGTFAIKTFVKDHWNIHICFKMENTSAVAYVNHMGGTHSHKLSDAAKDLWTWCLDKGMTVSAEYFPGVLNTTADFYSRSIMGSAEWKLDLYVFQQVARRFAPIQVDLFATRINTQLAQYISWKPDPFAMAMDALMTSWTNLQGYAFPPFCLFGRCLQKIASEQATVFLIAPVWVHQPWYPAVLDALVEIPVLLPLSDSLLLDPFNQPHPLVLSHALKLAAWIVSGKDSLRQEFRNRLLASSLQAGAGVPTLHTNLPGPDCSPGVSRGSGYLFSICDRLRQLLGQPLQRGSSILLH